MVYLARHAETEWNVQRRRQGRLDSPLTAAGVAQTHRRAAALKPMAIDAIFARPLGRTVATARILDPATALTRGHPHGVVLEIDPRARTCREF
jgi:broad specificity phosphatase PhoE